MDKRTKTIIIRCTEKEHAEMMERKTKARLAEWLRELALGERVHSHVTHTLPPEITRTLAGIGSNLNQIGKGVNTMQKQGTLSRLDLAEVQAQLVACERVLNEIRGTLK